jgi:putative hydrolase of the HAD superfamily
MIPALVKAVIFDLDDTLYPESDYVKSGFKEVSIYLGKILKKRPDYIFKKLHEIYVEGIRGNNFNVFLDEEGVVYDEALILDLVNVYRRHTPQIELPKVSRELLIALHERGFKTGVITDGYLEPQIRKVKSLGLEDLVEEIIYTDVWGREFWKPHPRAFREIAKLLEVETKECAYVADNPEKDFKGAKDCGMYCCQVLQWVERDLESVTLEYRPDIVVEKLEDILEIISSDC